MASYSFGTRNLHDLEHYVLRRVGNNPGFSGVNVVRSPLGAREGSAAVERRATEHVIQMTGWVVGADAQAVDDALDNLTRDLYAGVQQLRLGMQDERYWLAQLQKFEVNRDIEPVLVWEAEFLVTDPYAYSDEPLTCTDVELLDEDSDDTWKAFFNWGSVEIGGTAPTWPVIRIDTDGVDSITFYNDSTNQGIKVLGPLTIGIVVEIDCARMTVKVADVDVDFEGQFPCLDPRAGVTNTISIRAENATQPNVQTIIDWRSRF